LGDDSQRLGAGEHVHPFDCTGPCSEFARQLCDTLAGNCYGNGSTRCIIGARG